MGIYEAINKFQGISLAQMDAVKLMNRTDRKYWFACELLPAILEEISDEYYIMEIGSERNLPYATTYYDTSLDEMYNNHHRGKLNRYKIRRRNYVSTGSSFLEIKFKSNKGRTMKVRRASEYGQEGFDAADREFLEAKSPYRCGDLEPSLENGFRRLMLVSKAMDERCTIDSELRFLGQDGRVELYDMVVVEVKTDGRSHSRIIDALNQRRIKPSGFSKYCIGRSLTCEALKTNNFKRKHRQIEKIVDNPIKRERV